jgi:Glycosyltransferase sugar-binding region containing DXD motif
LYWTPGQPPVVEMRGIAGEPITVEKIIHFTVPAKLKPLDARVIECARALHPNWEVKVWQDPIKPDGYLLEKYWPKVNSGAQFSDLLRLDVLYKWGGVYVDSDLQLLKPLDALADTFDFFMASQDGWNLTNALIGAKKAHPEVRRLIDELLTNEPDWSVPPYKTTGPYLFTRMLKHDKDITVLPRETFYSYNWDETRQRRNHRHSYGEHFWEKSWKAQEPEQNATPAYIATLQRLAKRAAGPVLGGGFGLWHRIKSFDPSPPARASTYPLASELVVRSRHGFDLVVDGSDPDTPELIFAGGEASADNFVKRTLRGGDWALDVGVGNGYLCISAAQAVQPLGQIFAYGPNADALKRVAKSVAMNRVLGHVVLQPTGSQQLALDEQFPVDLPIKLLRIGTPGHAAAPLKGARRLLEHRCIDNILIEADKERAGFDWSGLLSELDWVTNFGYTACTLRRDGSLVEQKNAYAALDGLQGRYLVLVAKDQHTPSDAATMQ